MIGSVLQVRYELTGLTAEGPVFSTYAARDQITGREVSVRLLRSPYAQEPQFVLALDEAVRKSAMVQHPGLESLVELVGDDENPFIVGEAVRGVSLIDRIRKLAPFSVPVSVATSISVLEALDALHRAGTTHGDVGAHNVTVEPTGMTRLQLAGIWEAYSASDTAGVAVLPNMAPYLAPEVSAGARPNPSSDVYSAGILLYELLAGRPPYLADLPSATAARHATAATPSVRMYNPSVPTVLDEIVKKAMAKDPAARYAMAGEMLADLRVLQDALRFGRTLTWPLHSTTPTPAAATTPVPTPVATPVPVRPLAPAPVTPKMSAIREEEEERPRRRVREERERDVPLWLMFSIVFCLAVVLALFGVWFLFNMNRPRLVTVPNIKGAAAAEARETLQAMKLDMHVVGRQTSSDVDLDHVVSVSPAPGGKVREGSQVGVVISSGSPFVKVPPLKGMTEDRAKTLLESLSLELDTSVQRRRDRNAPEGTIIDQDPKPNKRAERFTPIRVTVSTGDGGLGPASDEAYRYNLSVRLTDLEAPTNVRVEMTDDRETRVIYEGRHADGERIRQRVVGYGKEVTFRIYYDGEMVKEVPMQAREGDRQD